MREGRSLKQFRRGRGGALNSLDEGGEEPGTVKTREGRSLEQFGRGRGEEFETV